MNINNEREAFEEVFPRSAGTVLNEYGHYESQVNQQDAMIQNISWVVWQAAKSQAVPEGFVLMPIKPTETMVMAVVKEHEGDAFLPYSLYDAYVKQAMIEAQEPAND